MQNEHNMKCICHKEMLISSHLEILFYNEIFAGFFYFLNNSEQYCGVTTFSNPEYKHIHLSSQK
jgi:hypothetical protein